MNVIFVAGTAGAGKSLLTSKLLSSYSEKGSNAIAVNLDPGAIKLPYTPVVDVRDYVDLNSVMERYELGPNGALIFASDYIATRWSEIQAEIDGTGADYAIIDTPGQMEVFTYRNSGSFIVSNVTCTQKVVVFLVDATLTTTPSNLVSMAFLTYSIRLRLGAPQVVVLSKSDMVNDKIDKILNWTSSLTALEEALREEGGDSENYVFVSNILRVMSKIGFAYGIIPTSSVTLDGFTNLSSALSRILTGGEEVVD